MSRDHVPGAIPQAEQNPVEVPLGRVPLGAVPRSALPRVGSRAVLTDTDRALAAAEIERAVESLAPPPPPPPPPQPANTDADRAAVRATFEDLAVLHVSPVRNLMLEVRWGAAPTRFIKLARPALQSLQQMAAALELDDLVAGLSGFDAALGEMLASGEETIQGERREALLGAYFPLQSGFAAAFGLEGGKERREPIVIDALLDGVEGVDQAVIDKLSLVGLGRLEPLLKAKAEEIKVVSDIPRAVAERIAVRVRERVQQAPKELSTQTRGHRASRGERTVLEWLTAELLREQTLMRLRRGERVERPGLRGAELAGADLRRLDLRRAELTDANLTGADLGGVNLENADLGGARLQEANLMGANLSRANLAGANLTGANLRGARLSFASLTSTNLTGATLRDATVMHADLEWSNLRQVQAAGGNFSGAHFEGSVLDDADFSRARLDETTFEDVRAHRTSFAGTTFAAANLRGADLSGADLRDADLRRASIDRANLSGALVTGLRPTGLAAEGLRVDYLALDPLEAWPPVPPGELGAALARVFTGKPGADAQASASGTSGTVERVREARLLFADGARVTLTGLLESCVLHLGPRTELVIGENAALVGCWILGGARITIAGAVFAESEADVPLVEPGAVIVTKTGVLVGRVQQRAGGTKFAFDKGARLRLAIAAVPPETPR